MLVRIGRWIPHVGFSSRVHSREVLLKEDWLRTQLVWAKLMLEILAVTFGRSLPSRTKSLVLWL